MKIKDTKTSELHYNNIKLIAACVIVAVSISAKAVITAPDYRFEPPKETTFPTNIIQPYALSPNGTNSHPKTPAVQPKHLPKNIEHRRQLLRSLHQ